LDEATSALDSESEAAIRRSIDELKGQTTVIMIAHRLATVRNVDEIVVLEGGQIAETGSYTALRGDPRTRFSKLVTAQKL
jgi:ABC-type multidrug transport system fused ATPase/permease subunit